MIIEVKCSQCGFVQRFDDLDNYKCDDCGCEYYKYTDENDYAAH